MEDRFRRGLSLAVLSASVLATGGAGGAPADARARAMKVLPVGHFTADDARRGVPRGWEEPTFDRKKSPRRSRYRVVAMDGGYVLRAETDSGVSGLFRPVALNAREMPYIVWRWRVEQVFTRGDARTKCGDDYPARVYAAFKYDPARAGWRTRMAFALARRRSKMIAACSGRDGLRRRHVEARNYYRNFKRIVGEEPPPVEYIAVMIDGDGTGSKGVAYFADIELRSEPPPGVRVGPAPVRARAGERQ